MILWVNLLLTSLSTILASSGVWAYMSRRDNVRTQTDRLLRGLAYDKIVTLGMAFIERGWITQDEYEEYRKYLFDPYRALGGNGVTERVMAEVTSLPLKPRSQYVEVLNDARTRRPSCGFNDAIEHDAA